MTTLADLDRHRYMSLATFRRNGAEVRTPVWFAAADGRLYVFTAGDSGKVKRLRHSPRARVAPSDARGRARGGWCDATARIVTEVHAIGRARAALRAKYGWQMWLADLFSRLSGRIQRRAWIEIELSRWLEPEEPCDISLWHWRRLPSSAALRCLRDRPSPSMTSRR